MTDGTLFSIPLNLQFQLLEHLSIFCLLSICISYSVSLIVSVPIFYGYFVFSLLTYLPLCT